MFLKELLQTFNQGRVKEYLHIDMVAFKKIYLRRFKDNVILFCIPREKKFRLIQLKCPTLNWKIFCVNGSNKHSCDTQYNRKVIPFYFLYLLIIFLLFLIYLVKHARLGGNKRLFCFMNNLVVNRAFT